MPALGFLNVYFHLFSFVADHFQYHASPAMFALAAAGISTGYARARATLPRPWAAPWIGRAAAATTLAALSCVAFRAESAFRDEATLYRRTLARNPASWTAHSNLGVLLREAGRFEEAEDEMRDALRIAPTKYQVRYDYGQLIMARGERGGFRPGDLDQAIGHFKAAAEISPQRPEPYVGLAGALMRALRYEEAIVNLDRALQIEPNDTNALYLRGLIAAERGQTVEAKQWLSRALRISPDQPELHFALGAILASEKQYGAAADRFGQVVRLRPTDVAAWNNRALALLELGKVDRAVECYQAVVKLLPNSPEAQANLAAALKRQTNERPAKTDSPAIAPSER